MDSHRLGFHYVANGDPNNRLLSCFGPQLLGRRRSRTRGGQFRVRVGKNISMVFSSSPNKEVLAGALGKASLRTLWLEPPDLGICVRAWAMAGVGGRRDESLTATPFRYCNALAVPHVWDA